MDISLIALVLCAALLAGFTQGFAGFGSTIVALPVLCLGLSPHAALPLGSLLALAINLCLCFSQWRNIELRRIAVLLICLLPGLAAGAYLLGAAPQWLIKCLLGLALLLFALLSLRGWQPDFGRSWQATLATGMIAGCCGASIGINGPPVVAWASAQGFGRSALKASLAAFFFLAGLGNLSAQASQGLLNASVVRSFGLGLPALLAGVWLGWRVCGRLNDNTFKKLLFMFIGLSGIVLIAQALG